MFSWLHNFTPHATLVSLGPLSIHWYGFFMAAGILTAIVLTLKLSKRFGLSKELVWDISFYLIIFGLIGARIYEVFLELPFYWQNPTQIIKIWEGGLAIHGAIIGGGLALYFLSKKYQINFWKLVTLIIPGLTLGQAIGRFGNWFNQELFGLPSTLPWSIPIELARRPSGFSQFNFFHPTFLYESFGLVIILAILIFIIYKSTNQSKLYFKISATYLLLASTLRLMLEFIKIDKTPMFLHLRWPQIICLILIALSLILFKKSQHA